jgi:hypothetical protein
MEPWGQLVSGALPCFEEGQPDSAVVERVHAGGAHTGVTLETEDVCA